MVLAVAAGVAVGCTAAPGPGSEQMGGSPEELGSALNVTVAGDSVRLELHVTNATEAPLLLEFPTSQRYDFAVLEGGAEVWRWSSDMMFAQALGTEELLPGESRRYMTNWPVPGRAGDYVAEGRLTSTNYPVALRTSFRLPVE